ncbi:optineurin isoform X2 [Lepisosteus oculatus]|uniref:Optineurin n=1 Tax=Lepisosteus oculatus TaxID=7918 RepID=W5NFE0_LEPOC|nr:PREDICTED: optineurin isoform X2 [Lepisosteus oculatus]
MASGAPMVNGEDPQGPERSRQGQANGAQAAPHVGTPEETLQQMNILIKENSELKEALKQTNTSMKERFEGLAAWKEKQKEEREFLENKFLEAKNRVTALTKRNEELRKRLQHLEGNEEGTCQSEMGGQSSEVEALKVVIARLQAEKSDLLAMNSELQLKLGRGLPDDAFIEIRIAKEGDLKLTKDLPSSEKDPSAAYMPKSDETNERMEPEELTVSQLLQSLRHESQKVEKLELELQAYRERISVLEKKAEMVVESATQTSLIVEGNIPSEPVGIESTSKCEADIKVQQSVSAMHDTSTTEVENLKSQMKSLFKELQQAQSKLDDAEDMKRNLHNKCREIEQDLSTLRAQLVDKQKVQNESDKLKLQLESMQSVGKMEQRKMEEEKRKMTQLKDAYTKLFEDYNEIKKAADGNKRTEDDVIELNKKLAVAEQALAAKQLQIDEMKQDIFKKEQELDTISVFKAQAEVYSSDFYAERAAREKIHEEKERLAAQLEFVKKQNSQLQEEMESLGRQSLNEMQRRHVPRGMNPHGNPPQQNAPGARGADNRDWQQQVNIPEHACPKCNEILPDLDSLQIHIMDCII